MAAPFPQLPQEGRFRILSTRKSVNLQAPNIGKPQLIIEYLTWRGGRDIVLVNGDDPSNDDILAAVRADIAKRAPLIAEDHAI